MMVTMQEIANAVAAYLDKDIEGDYVFFDDDMRFEVAAETESVLGQVRIFAVITENGLITYTALGPMIEPAQRLAAAEYLTRANHGLPNGNFEMNMDDGVIDFKVFVNCRQLPGEDDIRDSFIIPLAVINKYGDGLIDVVVNGKAPKDVIEAIENR